MTEQSGRIRDLAALLIDEAVEIEKRGRAIPPETPEPAELGKLILTLENTSQDFHEAVADDFRAGGDSKPIKEANKRNAEDALKDARKAIVDFVAREISDLTAENKRILADNLRYAEDALVMQKTNTEYSGRIAAGEMEASEELQAENEKLKAELASSESMIGRQQGLIDAKSEQIAGLKAAVEDWKAATREARDQRNELKAEPTDTDVAVEHIKETEPAQTPLEAAEPERKPGDTWCAKWPARACNPRDLVCGRKRGQKVVEEIGGVPYPMRLCKQCPEFRPEPDDVTTAEPETCDDSEPELAALSDGRCKKLNAVTRFIPTDEYNTTPCELAVAAMENAIRELEANQKPPPGKQPVRVESERAMSPELTELFGPVEWPDYHDHPANCGRLALAIIDLEANQRPGPINLGTSIQAAIAALPATLRADATDMAEVATAAGEPVLGLRLLVSMRTELIDPTATCGECERYKPEAVPHASWCNVRKMRVYANRIACVKLQRKPERRTDGRSAPVRLQFFRQNEIPGAFRAISIYDPSGNGIYASGMSLRVSKASLKPTFLGSDDTVDTITEAEAMAEVADRPEVLEKLRAFVVAARKEPKPAGKARFFLSDYHLWVYPVGCKSGIVFAYRGPLAITNSSSLLSDLFADNTIRQVTDITAVRVIAKADWPEGLAKLKELIGGDK